MSVEINIEFERECYSCLGRSAYMAEQCGTCNSTGKVPTELGQELLEFLEHQGVKPVTIREGEKR